MTLVRHIVGSMRTLQARIADPVRAPSVYALVGGLRDLRFLGFATGVFCSFGFSLVLAPLLGVGERSCFAHWSYGVGELTALLASARLWLSSRPSLIVAHAVVTVSWSVAVSADCHLWIALATGSSPVLKHGM